MDTSKDIGSILGQGLHGLEDSETTYKILSLSYQDLPHFLKPCFLYMSTYREDQYIDPRNLYHMWIAEGIISPGYLMARESLMNVAERFLQELNLRCMVELQMDRMEGKINSCKLHDLMRDLCLKKAKEELFLERIGIDIQVGRSTRIDSSISENASRLAMDLNIDKEYTKCVEVFDQLTRHQHLRSFSVSGKVLRLWGVTSTVEASQVERFKLLRVLDFENLKFHNNKLPNGIGELIHLRYLSLRNCVVSELPSFVGDLPLLQTLDLRVRYCCIKIPYDIFSKKKRLRHLYFSEFVVTGTSTEKLKLDGLSELESLIIYKDIHKVDLNGLSGLVNMRYFKYHCYNNVVTDWPLIMEQMKSWKRIQVLHIIVQGGDDAEDIKKIFMSHNITHMVLIGCKLKRPPAYEQLFCQNLVSLEIVGCAHIDNEFIDFVGKFPKLRRLSMISGTQIFDEISFTDMAFPQLNHLALHCKKLTISARSLSNLITLQIGHCEEIVPEDGLKYLHNLQELCLQKDDYLLKLKEKCWRHHPQYAHISIKEVDLQASIRNLLQS